ncbi:MAG: hypothetical protein A2Z14_10075 [Chloroflexi bacterium RBG_16_48_8]|nr:MAG: hypothetical protein A2Z14_10075 [Chloroflexi bacterium RBG_16_48_8]
MKKYISIALLFSFLVALIPFNLAQASALQASCTDKATFISDVTIPDKARIEAGKLFEKTWRLKNSGTCTWSPSYAMVFASGQQMGGPASVTLPKSVSPNGTVDLKVTLTAPNANGTYTSAWKLRNASGVIFGLGTKADQPFWVQIVVGTSSQPSPGSSSGWKAEYFANTDLIGKPKLTRTDSKIDFDWKRNAPATGLPKDNFSIRWTQTIDFSAGIYRFKLLADDKATLWVGDRMVLRVPASGSTQGTYDLALLQGKHKVTVEYHELTGDARVRLTWEKISPSFTDWKGEYWANAELKGNPSISRNDKAIDFRWREKAPVIGMPRDKFSARWMRTVNFQDGLYRFSAKADDGIRVYIDGTRVLNEWHSATGTTIYTFDKQLKGNHAIVVEYYEGTGNAVVKAWWEKVVPAPPTPTTPPPVPQIVYSFAEQFCSAQWSSGAGVLPCPGTDGDTNGFVLRPENPVLENGVTETQLTLRTVPQQIPDGLIRGTFPDFTVQSGDHFKATIGCLSGATACDVMFQLNYRIGDGNIQNLASWTETNNGQTQTVDIDLTPLAGKSVKFILTVLANGQPTDDQALWILPRIMR